MFEKIKNYYDSGLWNVDRVWNTVGKPTGITKDDYKKITGLDYPNKAKS